MGEPMGAASALLATDAGPSLFGEHHQAAGRFKEGSEAPPRRKA